jgi:hypothetical protein
MYDIFFISSDASSESFISLKERFPLLKLANSFEDAKRRTFTTFFWIVWPDLLINPDFKFDYQVTEWDKSYVHVFKNREFYDGVSLHPKSASVSSREIQHRFFINKKEIDIQASTPVPYDIFYVDDYASYLHAVDTTTTDRFWIVWDNIVVDSSFDFSYRIPAYDASTYVHMFKNGEYFDGVCLFSKKVKVSQREFEYRSFLHKKEVEIPASTPKPFDIVFISYNEPQADTNYKRLTDRFPSAKRVHGVKGIHQAHIEAAKLSTTEMFWVVDADALVVESFNFSFPQYIWHDEFTKNTVHVWRSLNPINKLEYGYGGVKLLPKELTLNMDVNSIDMTTSISKNFKAVPVVSNITAFNIDPFNTWRSAFRECCKLAVTGNEEALSRLAVWCRLNENVSYGAYAYMGAIAGKDYGEKNASNPEALSKINDFNWLNDQFIHHGEYFSNNTSAS